MPLTKKLAAEFLGTFWLVLGGCGSAVPNQMICATWRGVTRLGRARSAVRRRCP